MGKIIKKKEDTDMTTTEVVDTNAASSEPIAAWKSMLSSDALHRASKRHGVGRRRNESDISLAERMMADFKKNEALDKDGNTNLVRCDECRLESPPEGDECPFCGDKDPGVEVDTKAAVATAEKMAADASAMAPDPTVKKGKKVKVNGVHKTDDVAGAASSTAVLVDDAPQLEGTKIDPNASLVQIQTAHGSIPMPPGTITTVVHGTMGEDAFSRDVAELRSLRGDVQGGWWKLGRKLAEVEASKSWELRKTGTGARTYKSFDAFCSTEVGLSAETVKNAIDVSKKYSEEIVAQVGMSKMILALRAPDEDQAKIVDKAKAGATFREIKEDVREAKARKEKETGKAHVRESGRHAGGRPAQTEPKPSKLTVAWVLDKTISTDLKVKKKGEWTNATPKDLANGESIVGQIEMNGSTNLAVGIVKRKDGRISVTVKPIRANVIDE